MKKKNIYMNQSQDLLTLFEEGGSSAKVMCVPIDYAKKDHTVMFCNSHGDILRKPFSIKNSPEGLDYLVKQVTRSCLHRSINPKHVFFGGEDVGSYADNFVSTLRSKGWLVAGVNAHDAKKQRTNMQASTDVLDLMGIATMLINRRANCDRPQSGIYLNLRNLVRHRAKLVKMTTQVRNQIHMVVDRLFPGFLDEKKSGITPFTKSSLYLMENRFSAPQIRRRRKEKFIEVLKQHGMPQPEQRAAQLQGYAQKVLMTPNEYMGTLQLTLFHHVRHLKCLQDNIEQLEKEIAVWLAQTQGAFLTTIRGIGIVLAAGVTGEIGDPNKQKPVNNLVSYSGIIPRVKQTGGPEGKTSTGKVAKRCNHNLKNYVVQSGMHLGLHGPTDLMADHKRRDAAGQHADFGIGRRYVRMAMSLMRNCQVYIPPHLRNNGVEAEERAGYYLMTWPKFREKWNKCGALDVAFAKENPLGQWRNMVQELYGITLKL